jgi:thiol-disulfide isomerase/thioredoxin
VTALALAGVLVAAGCGSRNGDEVAEGEASGSAVSAAEVPISPPSGDRRVTVSSDAVIELAEAPHPEGFPSARDFTLPSLAGDMIKLSDFKGQVVILDFWATWCGPCRREIPHFIELREEYGDDGLAIVGIALDRQGQSKVEPFARQMKMNYPTLLDPTQVAAQIYGPIQGIPTTYVIDREGYVRQRLVGYRDKATFERIVQDLL